MASCPFQVNAGDLDNLFVCKASPPPCMQMPRFPHQKKTVYCSNCIIASLIVVNKFPNSPIITAALSGPRRQASMTKAR